jgi:hypothetical protein
MDSSGASHSFATAAALSPTRQQCVWHRGHVGEYRLSLLHGKVYRSFVFIGSALRNIAVGQRKRVEDRGARSMLCSIRKGVITIITIIIIHRVIWSAGKFATMCVSMYINVTIADSSKKTPISSTVTREQRCGPRCASLR